MTHLDISQIDPSVHKWAKWVIILLIARVPRPFHWAGFLSLNPIVRKLLFKMSRSIVQNKDPITTARRISKISNVISCFMLYFATSGNSKIPKDYISIYLWLNYYGILNPPSASKIVISPKLSPIFKIDTYRNRALINLYKNKEYIIYPLIFGQILSNYLTPTRYRLNQRYLSSSIKSKILNPIWINYSLGVNFHYVNWSGLLQSYLIHNLVLSLFIGLASFKQRFLDHYYALKYGIYEGKSLNEIIKNYSLFVLHKTNSYVNFIYSSNLISILLISITSPILSYLRKPTNSRFNYFYSNHMKLFYKAYIKAIGYIAAFITLYANSMNLIPDYGYKPTPDDSGENIRKISKPFLDGLNLYLFRLILLSKWRIIKENYPYLRLLRLRTWNKIEALIMCFGIYNAMNLNDFVKRNINNANAADECKRLQNETLIKLVDKIM